ncbi:hypothetical protein AVEN_246448-1 [Araneus ventricosus]|uniref:Uncharacterized protein n=1 Tax=Araneus ventricosus TaxID=182803 RepID=A0A4Y2UK56_ARAVE|nr:hypothetical protein AVEN_246448-1 [Araneus ventricosus]
MDRAPKRTSFALQGIPVTKVQNRQHYSVIQAHSLYRLGSVMYMESSELLMIHVTQFRRRAVSCRALVTSPSRFSSIRFRQLVLQRELPKRS